MTIRGILKVVFTAGIVASSRMASSPVQADGTASEAETAPPPWLMPNRDPNRDPNAPQRNMSAFLLYRNSMRDVLKEQNRDLTFAELEKLMSKSYMELSPTEKEKWAAEAKADKERYTNELAAYVPPPGYDAKGDAIVVEPTPNKGRAVTRSENNRDMKVIVAKSGVEVTEENPLLKIFMFPRNNGKAEQDQGEPFFEWTGIESYLEPTALDRMEERLYDGYRMSLEWILRKGWERMAADFKEIPKTAKWSIQNVEGALMPILQDDDHVYLVLPTSAQCLSRNGELTMPTPFQDRERQAGSDHFMNHDVWFEDCGDGGVYVLGMEEKVLVLYVDDPGDMVMNRWQCPKDQWETMWLSAFGTTTIKIDDHENDNVVTSVA